MFLVKKTSSLILKNIFIFFAVIIFSYSFFIFTTSASTTNDYVVTGGTDSSGETSAEFSASDIEKLSVSDSEPGNGIDRMRSEKWPDDNQYNEDRYIEFIFSPNIPQDAVISEVKITHEFQRSAALVAAKIEVWDGENFIDQTGTTLGTSGEDHTDVVDITSILDTAEKINNTKIRFLTYRATVTQSGTTTGHDFIGLSVTYDIPAPPPEPEPVFFTEIDSDIAENIHWTIEKSPYVIRTEIFVKSEVVLSIDEGVIVKFDSGGSLVIDGTLEALGTETNPIYFTSFLDDAIGGDTNNDGGESVPDLGDWNYILIKSETIQSTLNYVFQKYSDSGLVLYAGGSVISDNFNSDKGIMAFGSDSSFTNLTVSNIELYDESVVSIDGALISNQDGSVVNVQNKSSLDIKNATIKSESSDYLISIYDNSSASFDTVDIINEGFSDAGLALYSNSSLKADKISVTDSDDGFLIFNNSSAMITDATVVCGNDGISLYDSSTLKFSGGSISCNNYGMVLYGDAKADISNTKISDAMNVGIIAYNNTDPSPVSVTGSEIINNNYGFVVFDSLISAHENDITGNLEYGVFTFPTELNPVPLNLDFKNNWWGDESGPYNEVSNPAGLGDSISNNILFSPWLPTDPSEIPVCTVDCFSNVLFFPGLMGSRLYEQGLNCGPEIIGNECGDKELWVSASDPMQEKLLLNDQGKSINEIYTKNDTQKLNEDGDETGIVDDIVSFNIYQSFIADLKKWKENDKIIEDYAFIPYDWRLSLDDIITNGIVKNSDNLFYNTSQNFSESFILKKLEALQKSSKSGKVTIVAHSNGGLVVKALIQKLKDTNNPLYAKIDKIIFVAVPQLGTPDALIALLHGNALGHGLIMSAERSRQLTENMPTIYNLLPSASYFSMPQVPFVLEKLVSFENNPIFNTQISQYGLDITSSEELKNYILGTDGRNKPSFDDTVSPNIGNSILYSQTESVHQILDSWSPPPNTKVIQIAGWGEETIAGLDYRTYKGAVSYKPRVVIDGDGTVVVPSALWMSDSDSNVERWWVDLQVYNKLLNFNISREHKNILEIQNLSDFIKSNITNSVFNDLDNIVVNNSSTLISDDSRLHFILHSPLTLGITDIEGKYTGQDPVTQEIKEEIPNVNYKQIGEVQFLSIPAGITYTLKLQGYTEGSFSLDIEKQTGNTITNSTLFEGISSSVATLATIDITPSFEVSTSKLKVDQNGDGDIDQIYQIIDGEIQITSVSDNNTSGSSGGSRNLSLFRQTVEQSITEDTKETKEENQKIAKIETSENIVNKLKIEQQDKETGTSIPEEVKKIENVPLLASVVNSGFSNNQVLYVIILTILLVLIFLIRRFVKL